MNPEYRKMKAERDLLGIPPLPLTEAQVDEIINALKMGLVTPADGPEDLLTLLQTRVPPGVDPAAKRKAEFMVDVLTNNAGLSLLDGKQVIETLKPMQGGYSLAVLLFCLQSPGMAPGGMEGLSATPLAAEAIDIVYGHFKAGNEQAALILQNWLNATWFTQHPPMPDRLPLCVYRVKGEVNTDDLSPAKYAFTRPDIPLHALKMGETRFPGGYAAMHEMRQSAQKALAAKEQPFWPVFVADTLGTGSSRKSATNSLVWLLGRDIPNVPNRRRGGVVLANRIAPIFYNSFEDAGGLPLVADVGKLETGQRIVLRLDAKTGQGRIMNETETEEIAAFTFPRNLADEYRAGGRINFIIGRRLTSEVSRRTGLPHARPWVEMSQPQAQPNQGYTLAQKLVGRACGRPGVLPGENCEPAMATVGSQDTTGPMTRDELNSLACLQFAAPLVLQSFCHTAAYPNEADRANHASLPPYITSRGGVALRPGDGIIHSWLNRLLLPDQVGTGGDSHTRFPLGISFAAGSGLVALAASQGFMPIEMPESVLVKFGGKLPEGITLRDLVNAIPLFAIKAGLLDRPGEGNRNVFNGRILEMEGLPDLTPEEAFELTCASAERSAAAATIALAVDKVEKYLRHNVAVIQGLIDADYQSRQALVKRKAQMETWLKNPDLVYRDEHAEFAARLDLDLAEIREPILACPNNPDQVRWLSELSGRKIDEVFLGSCMSSLDHFRLAAKLIAAAGGKLAVERLWITPPTRLDREVMEREGMLKDFAALGARVEIPGCSLCMGNQARVEPGAAVFSTSTRNFDNRMGDGAQVYLGSAVLAAATAVLGKLPTPAEYFMLYHQIGK